MILYKNLKLFLKNRHKLYFPLYNSLTNVIKCTFDTIKFWNNNILQWTIEQND